MTGMLELPTELIERAKAYASGNGYPSVAACLDEIFVQEGELAPPAACLTREELVIALKEARTDEVIPCDDSYWKRLHEEFGSHN